MAFINLEHVDTNFGKTAPIKCPVCHNDFLVGADDNQPHGWPYLIHVPRVLKETDDQFIRKDELTCPFLLKPIALSIDCPDFYRNVLGYSFREKFLPADYKDYPDDYVGFMVEPDMFLPDLIKSYSRMMKLRALLAGIAVVLMSSPTKSIKMLVSSPLIPAASASHLMVTLI